MAVIPRDELSFTRIVEQYFLALKGRGLMISAVDLARIRAWEQTGVPIRAVCEAIRSAFDRHQARHGEQARPPESLSFCSRAVNRAIKAWREANVGSRSQGS
jgi:hypothetical protein